MNGQITRAPYRESICAGCRVFTRFCFLVRDVHGELVCPDCVEHADDAPDDDDDDHEPHCACRGVCAACTPGA